MRRLLFWSLCAAILLSTQVLYCQTVYFVDINSGDDQNPGTSWDAAKASISAALALTSDGDSIYVAEGTYGENLVLPRRVALLGGFPTGGGPRDPQNHATVIDGQNSGSVIKTNPLSNDLVDGFTVTGGEAEQGGGVYALGSSIFRNLLITGNNASQLGGGIFCGQEVTVENCTIENNTATAAPAMALVGEASVMFTMTIRHNVIRHNVMPETGQSGGAIIGTLHFMLDFDRNLVVDNIASEGGMFIEDSFGEKRFDHNTFANNTKRGLTLKNAFTVTVSNSIIYGHADFDIDIQDGDLSNPTIRYSDLGLIKGLHQREQSISINPQFTDPANGDYTLMATSPCIDRGDPQAPLDPDGTITDMGVFPYLQSPVNVETPAAGQPSTFALAPLYPNPFSRRSTLVITLQKPEQVKLAIYDILGRRVRQISVGTMGEGSHALIWDGRDDRGRKVVSGIYYVVARVGQKQAVRKVVKTP